MTFHRPLAETLRTVSSLEFEIWKAAYEREPWGEARTELSRAMAAWAQIRLAPGRTELSLKVSDLMPNFRSGGGEASAPEQSEEEQIAIAAAIAAATGSSIVSAVSPE